MRPLRLLVHDSSQRVDRIVGLPFLLQRAARRAPSEATSPALVRSTQCSRQLCTSRLFLCNSWHRSYCHRTNRSRTRGCRSTLPDGISSVRRRRVIGRPDLRLYKSILRLGPRMQPQQGLAAAPKEVQVPSNSGFRTTIARYANPALS